MNSYDDRVSPASMLPGRHGVWTTCGRCDQDNWCISDPAGEQDDISGEFLDYVCWDFCNAVLAWDDEWNETYAPDRRAETTEESK